MKLRKFKPGYKFEEFKQKVCVFITTFNLYKKLIPEEYITISRDTDSNGQILDEYSYSIYFDLLSFQERFTSQNLQLKSLTNLDKLAAFLINPDNLRDNPNPTFQNILYIFDNVNDYLNMKRRYSQGINITNRNYQQVQIPTSLLKSGVDITNEQLKTTFTDLDYQEIQYYRKIVANNIESDGTNDNIPHKKRCLPVKNSDSSISSNIASRKDTTNEASEEALSNGEKVKKP